MLEDSLKILNYIVNSMKYILINFPDIQEYMDLEGFEEHSSLADCDKFGASAYFVEEEWLDNCNKDEE